MPFPVFRDQDVPDLLEACLHVEEESGRIIVCHFYPSPRCLVLKLRATILRIMTDGGL